MSPTLTCGRAQRWGDSPRSENPTHQPPPCPPPPPPHRPRSPLSHEGRLLFVRSLSPLQIIDCSPGNVEHGETSRRASTSASPTSAPDPPPTAPPTTAPITAPTTAAHPTGCEVVFTQPGQDEHAEGLRIGPLRGGTQFVRWVTAAGKGAEEAAGGGGEGGGGGAGGGDGAAADGAPPATSATPPTTPPTSPSSGSEGWRYYISLAHSTSPVGPSHANSGVGSGSGSGSGVGSDSGVGSESGSGSGSGLGSDSDSGSGSRPASGSADEAPHHLRRGHLVVLAARSSSSAGPSSTSEGTCGRDEFELVYVSGVLPLISDEDAAQHLGLDARDRWMHLDEFPSGLIAPHGGWVRGLVVRGRREP